MTAKILKFRRSTSDSSASTPSGYTTEDLLRLGKEMDQLMDVMIDIACHEADLMEKALTSWQARQDKAKRKQRENNKRVLCQFGLKPTKD